MFTTRLADVAAAYRLPIDDIRQILSELGIDVAPARIWLLDSEATRLMSALDARVATNSGMEPTGHSGGMHESGAPSPREYVYVSFIGRRAAAVAVGIGTWLRWCANRGVAPSRVILFDTDDPVVVGNGERISQWIAREAPNVTVDVRHAPALRSEHEDFRTLVEAFSALQPDAVVHLNLSPGLKFRTLANAQLGPSTLRTLYPSGAQTIFDCDDGTEEVIETVSLGLDTLLSLAGLPKADIALAPLSPLTIPEWLAGIAGSLLHGLPEIATLRIRGRSFVLAFERHGVLHVIVDERGLPPRTEIVDYERALLRSMQQATLGMLVQVLVVTDHQSLARRLRASGRPDLRVLLTTESAAQHTDTFRAWSTPVMATQPVPAADAAPSPIKSSSVLVTVLGSDPSATINALASHRPRRVLVLYDPSVPAIALARTRLEAMLEWSELPDNALRSLDVRWLATDAMGRGAREQLGALTNGCEVTVDVTAGTVRQGYVMVRLPGAKAWSQRTPTKFRSGDGVVSSLLGDETRKLSGASIMLQASVTGGPLKYDTGSQWFTADLLRAHSTFLEALKTLLLEQLPDATDFSWMQEFGASGVLRRKLQGKVERSAWPEWSTDLGGTFERVVAWAALGARCHEILGNVKWAWEPDAGPPTATGAARDEMDLILRYDSQYVAVECKSNRARSAGSLIAIATTHLERTAQRLGRFAFPLVVVPWLPRDADDLKHAPCPIVSFSTFADDVALKRVMDSRLSRLRHAATD